MKLFKTLSSEITSETDLKNKLIELIDDALEQSRNNMQISREILEMDIWLEENQGAPVELSKNVREEQDKFREKLRIGHEIHSEIRSEIEKIEKLMNPNDNMDKNTEIRRNSF